MRVEDRRALTTIIIGLAWGVLTMAGPRAFPDAPLWIWKLSFCAAGIVVVGALILLLYDLLVRPRLRGNPKLEPLLWIASTAFIVGILALGAYIIRGPQTLPVEQPDRPSPPVVSPGLSPSERDRLSNVIYELAQIVQKKGQPLVAQVYGISNQRRNMQLPQLKDKLLALQNDYVDFRSALFNRFVPENHYYVQQIMQMIGNQEAINDYHVWLNEYLVTIDMATGIDVSKAETLTSLADSHMVRAAENLNKWINGCDQRIGAMRAALR
jgi:hypothetical protein